ncbi:protein kinesin light chain-related 1 [Quercus suber]|uniref:Protein kinesin light chain-related 1 n=1 Tax=Quercus suber TaxID=58331 RepID=A0AAW0KH79_QUESU
MQKIEYFNPTITSQGRFEEAISVLERAIQVRILLEAPITAFRGVFDHMQLGDMFSMLGQVDRSIACYEEGLKIQIEALAKRSTRQRNLQV